MIGHIGVCAGTQNTDHPLHILLVADLDDIGIHDDIIKIEYAKESYKKFLSEDNFSFLTFYKGHEVIFEEIEHIKKFLMRI